jgi:hypothetical protein
MDLTLTQAGMLLSINFVIIISLTLKYAKGYTDNLPLVIFYSVLLSWLFFPAGWYYCWKWSKKSSLRVEKL